MSIELVAYSSSVKLLIACTQSLKEKLALLDAKYALIDAPFPCVSPSDSTAKMLMVIAGNPEGAHLKAFNEQLDKLKSEVAAETENSQQIIADVECFRAFLLELADHIDSGTEIKLKLDPVLVSDATALRRARSAGLDPLNYSGKVMGKLRSDAAIVAKNLLVAKDVVRKYSAALLNCRLKQEHKLYGELADSAQQDGSTASDTEKTLSQSKYIHAGRNSAAVTAAYRSCFFDKAARRRAPHVEGVSSSRWLFGKNSGQIE